MMYRVLIATALSESGLNLIRGEIGGLAKVVAPDALHSSPELATAEALIIRDELEVDATLLDKMPKLRVIGRSGAGIAGIDIETATRRGIVVMNTPGINAVSVAEHTFALLLGLQRHLIGAHTAVGDGKWNRNEFIGAELYGKTIGIIGLGRIGMEVARRAIVFGMRVLAYDPYVTEADIKGLAIKLVGMPELITSSDVVSIHSAYTTETHHLLNTATLAMIKPGAAIINTAHGSIIDEAALLQFLDNGRIKAAALDVLPTEPPSTENPLLNHPRVIHTPHIGDSTAEAQHQLSLMIVQQVLDALAGNNYRNVVNMPIVDGDAFELVLPYMHLAESMGVLLQNLASDAVQRVEIEFKGAEFQRLVKPMTVALLRGLLRPILGEEHVNYINAPVIANERNLFVTQAKGLSSAAYMNLLSCRIHWASGELTIAGALFNHTDPHIVQIDQYSTDIIPSGTLLVMGSYDMPGVIGRIGTLLAENEINIADWRTGRAEPGGNTLSVATLDAPVSEDFLETLRQQDYIRHVTQITF
jgi:D-3-phosphoglycerate dehydrogenase / 2-oxoglutarate reductase